MLFLPVFPIIQNTWISASAARASRQFIKLTRLLLEDIATSSYKTLKL